MKYYMHCIADFPSSVIFVHSIIFLTYAKVDFIMTSVNYQEYLAAWTLSLSLSV